LSDGKKDLEIKVLQDFSPISLGEGTTGEG
jgi:hypothetical protein